MIPSYAYPDDVFPNTSFISIAVPTFCRPFYLKKLLDTLEQFADMPYEVIVHDDGSPRYLQDEVYGMKDRISILSFNTGLNQGLPEASNHCISQASSKYVLFLNDDCFFVKPCLRDICNVLSKSYVGLLSPANEPGPLSPSEAGIVNGTRFCVSNFLGGGSTIAFRKDVWKEVGGWDNRSTSGQADNVFVYKILAHGYWKALMEGPTRIKVGNFEYGSDYKPTQPFSRGIDCSVPKIFGLTASENLRIAHSRRESCQYWVDGERHIPNRETYDSRPNKVRGLNDISGWGQHFLDMFHGKNSSTVADVDWEIAKLTGQDRWREQIFNDFPH